jgi:ElaB/YqjD/DUF883 family membrane-anchored ribosome-binding protein
MRASREHVRPAETREAPATEKASETAHEVIDSAAERARRIEREVRDRAAEAGEKIDESTAAARAHVDRSLSEFETYVREKPMIAVGVAFTAGALAAAILSRR